MDDHFIFHQDPGVVADGRNEVAMARQYQLVAEFRGRGKTGGEHFALLHLMLLPKLRPKRCVSRLEPRIGQAADAIDCKTRQTERSGTRIACREIRSVRKQRRKHRHIRGSVSSGIKPGSYDRRKWRLL